MRYYIVVTMPNKEMSDKKKAHMYFKRMKSGIEISDEELFIVKKYYPFMR